MTTPEEQPDWVTEIPSGPVHPDRQQNARPSSAQHMLAFGSQMIEQFLRRVVQAVVGFFIPGGGSAFSQLASWADDVNGGLQKFATLVTGIDFSQPPLEVWADIIDVFVSPLEKFAELVGGFVSAFRIPILDPSKVLNLPGLFSGVQDFLDGLASAFGGASSGNTAATVNAKAVEIAEAALNAEAAAIAAQFAAAQANQGSSTPLGIVVSVDIQGADGVALSGTDWGTSGPAADDVVVRGTSVPCVGIADGEAVGHYWVPSQYEFLTSNQRVEVVAGQGGGHGSASYTLIHCDTAITEGAYLKYTTAGLDCGRFTRSGSTFTFTPFAGGSWEGKIGSGSRVEIQNFGTTYDLSVNGVVVKTVVDAGATVTMDASHVTTAVVLERKLVTYNPGLPWETTGTTDSLRPSAVLISDYIPIVYDGSGARMYRTSTAVVAASSGVNPMPGSFFGVVGASTDDITSDPTTGKFTVDASGWYFVSFRILLELDTTTAATSVTALAPFPLHMMIYRNGSPDKYVGPELRPIPYNVTTSLIDGSVTGLSIRAPAAAHGSTELYLAAGDYVQLGYDAASASGSIFTGEATGMKSYFEIAQLSREAA